MGLECRRCPQFRQDMQLEGGDQRNGRRRERRVTRLPIAVFLHPA